LIFTKAFIRFKKQVFLYNGLFVPSRNNTLPSEKFTL
jgi:hypothetical protein